ncbi:MAG: DUF4177 domain-containing protein, partial [Gorillibacterium sp.]|nr:DUF4177 domain-containing protein [Gorillibacterium sp.]
MFEYKFVRVGVSGWSGKPKEDYYEIVHEHARQGW